MKAKARLDHIETFVDEFSVIRQSDLYVCMSVEITLDAVHSPHLFWRLGDAHSLVEIGVEESSGRLVSVQVVLYQKPFSQISPQPVKNVLIEGVPGFCLDLWEKPANLYDYGKYLYKVSNGCQLEFGERKLRIKLFSDESEYGVMLSGQLLCEFNKRKELCAVLVCNLSDSEMQTLEKYSQLSK